MNKIYLRFFTIALLILPFCGFGQIKKPYPRPPYVVEDICNFPGITPSTAIPVCGTSVFTQGQVFDCPTFRDINPTECVGSNFPSSKSFWYKFHCFSAGTLGFTIVPKAAGDDYDWIIFDMTGLNPDDVFTPGLRNIRSLNGSPENPDHTILSKTGASAGGIKDTICYDGNPVTEQFNKFVDLQVGHDYFLMVTSYPSNGSSFLGYDLTFGGGTAGITDGTLPSIQNIEADCNALKINFTTDVKCASVTSLGSECQILPGIHPITNITSDCPLGFVAIRNLTINLATPLAPGNYKLRIKNGSDGNTYNNICDNQIADGTEFNFVVPQPLAHFTGTPEACVNDIANFTSTSDPLAGNTIAQYHWDFGDATTGTGATPTHSYSSGGLYTVKHWITNSRGCNSDTASSEILINALPIASFNNNGTFCSGRNITFTDVSTPNAGTIINWHWDMGDGNIFDSTNANPFIYQYTSSGIKTVTLVVTTDKGCKSAIFSTNVNINDQPKADFIEPKVCLDDIFAQFNHSSTIPSGSITAWDWDFGDGGTGTGPNPTHVYTAVGPYDVRLIVTSNFGCTDTVNKIITVNGTNPTPDFSLVNTPTTICATDIVSIINHSTVFPGNITRVKINWDDVGTPGVFDTDNNPLPGKQYDHVYPNFQAPATKDFTIRFRAFSGSGDVCVNDKVMTVTLNASPSIRFNNIPDTCLLASPFLITQASEPNGIPGNGVYSGNGITDPNGMFDPAVAGVGTHIITYSFLSLAGCTDIKTKTIKVIDTSSARFSYNAAPHCDGTPVEFTDRSSVPAGVVLNNTTWDFGDGSPAEDHAPGSTFFHLFPKAGTYTVKMFNTSAYGCSSTFTSQQVLVSPVPKTLFNFVEASVCLPDQKVSFINKSTIEDGTENAFLYQWDLGDPASGPLNFSSAKTAPPHLYSTIGPYTVTLTVTSGAGCPKIYTDIIDFIHPQPVADFTVNKKSICFDEDVIFTDATDPLDGTTVSWHWDMGDGITPNTASFTHHYNDTGTFNVSFYIINSHNCMSTVAVKPFTVYPYPLVDAGPARRVLQGASFTLQPTVSGNDMQYLWTPGTYLNNNRILAPRVQNIQEDITYTLTVTGRGGCPAPDNVYIKVLKKPRIPNTFTPNSDGVHDKWAIEYLNDYPECRVQVFTRTGQKVFEHKGVYEPWDGTKNGKPLPVDTYYYIIEPGDGREGVSGYVTILK